MKKILIRTAEIIYSTTCRKMQEEKSKSANDFYIQLTIVISSFILVPIIFFLPVEAVGAYAFVMLPFIVVFMIIAMLFPFFILKSFVQAICESFEKEMNYEN